MSLSFFETKLKIERHFFFFDKDNLYYHSVNILGIFCWFSWIPVYCGNLYCYCIIYPLIYLIRIFNLKKNWNTLKINAIYMVYILKELVGVKLMVD